MTENKWQLLAVDDDSSQLWLLSRVLKRSGYEVEGFNDAHMAIDRFREKPFFYDAVISDLTMPQVSGFELAAKILDVRPGIPLILTSATLRDGDIEEAQRLGVRLILKGQSIMQMGATLQELLAGDILPDARETA